MDSELLVDPLSSWTGPNPDSNEKNPGFYSLNSGSGHPDFRRVLGQPCGWSRLSTMQGPGQTPCRVQIEPHAGSRLSTIQGPSQDPCRVQIEPPCRVQIEPHAGSRLGPMQGPKSEIDVKWTPDDHFGMKLGPNDSNRSNGQFGTPPGPIL